MHETILAVIPYVLGLYVRHKQFFSGKNLPTYPNEQICHLVVSYEKGYWQLSSKGRSKHLFRTKHNYRKFIGCDIKPFEDQQRVEVI